MPKVTSSAYFCHRAFQDHTEQMRKKLANQKQQQVDDEDDRIAKTVAERESKREVRFNISLSLLCFRQFLYHSLSERSESEATPPLVLAREFSQASICRGHLVIVDIPTLITTFALLLLVNDKNLSCLSGRFCSNRSERIS